VGTLQRSFYVGENIRQEDIRAKFENGTLQLTIPKVPETPQVEQKNLIAIEG
jgi:HSP20 family molecular chaperone IbpA